MLKPTPIDEVLTQAAPEPRWLAKGVFPRGTLMTLGGEQGAGKSTLCYGLAYAVVLGLPFLGYPTEPTTVCYFDEENSPIDFQKYNQRIWQGLGAPALDRIRPHLHLFHFAMQGGWKEAMLEVACTLKPGLIVIDTATPVLQIQDENDNSEASRAIQALRAVQKAASNDTSILILKHEKQRDEKGHRRTIRGAKVWLGAVDRTFYHIIPRGCRERKDGLRRTALVPDKLRSFGLESPIIIDPSWTDVHRTGLIFKGYSAPAKGDDDED